MWSHLLNIMHRTFVTLATFTALTGVAQSQTATVAQPTTPAPVVVTAPAQPEAPRATTPDRVTQTVYTPKLPTAQELTDAAAAQGLTVERISQTDLQVIAFYRSANGQPITVAYQSLPPAGVVQAPTPAPAPVVVTTAPPTTVVYESAPRVIFYDTPRYYYPRAYYPPVSLSFGFGYRGGYYGHGHHGHGHYYRGRR